ncbi:MAG: hypothetical protein K2Q14_01420 [Gammaproteobacteria bacterium]|nr:hypothetical protein [Gammaproteobacteria bacterium]
MLNNDDTPLVEALSWNDVRAQVCSVDKILADLIDNLDPDKNLKLLKARYSFGDLIVKDGTLYLPKSRGQLISLHDPTLDRHLQEKLNYSAIPLFLTLHNCNEVFIDTGARIIPLNLFSAGSLLGLFECTDYLFNRSSKSIWSVSAGSRSLFMLSKLNESAGFKRLRMHYRLPSTMTLQSLSDHWEVFKAIANHPHFEQPWQNEVLFFTKEWLITRDDDPHWVAFHRYLFSQAWNQAQFAIDKIEFSLSWETFIDAISSRRLKPTPYLADQIKHIMLIIAERSPGFRPTDNLQQIAPTHGLKKAITDIYLLKQYLPTMMYACPLNKENNLPVYYSLSNPTLLEGSPFPHNRNSSTIMLDLRDIKLLLDILIKSVEKNKKLIYRDFENINLAFFHVEHDKYEEILSSKHISEGDFTLLQELQDSPNRVFCSTSPFWRGCIRISHVAHPHK